ncbi:MAG: hypothetical protein QF903_07060 [Planctomycetota bacterium]|jgi:hypothetical protein|nr:hypothetical protein [Planctomycetota bacterium]MDP6762040.1 hypothetical protein [Planctomycetota bacterium]MDP6989223.1 hypothetical protein [Planctomycetota bacterium]
MQGSLCVRDGVVFVGCEERTAHVRSFDLDGRELAAGFDFRAPDGGRAAARGLDLDEDHRLWVADDAASALRAFTLFGAEVAGVEGAPGGDRRGELGAPVDVVSTGSDDGQELLVASAGVRRNAVQRLHLGSGRTSSLRSLGRPDERFRRVRRLARLGRWIWVTETGAGRIQVFRDGAFHFAFTLPAAGGAPCEPRAVAPLDDGRLVVAVGGAASGLLLTDASGRPTATLCGGGPGEGRVVEPNDLALESSDAHEGTRLVVIDSDGDRVQVFTLGGRCYGAFEGLRGPREEPTP